MRVFSRLNTIFISVALLGFAGCFERKVETRAKMERGPEKINIPQELRAFGDYDKNRDKILRQGYMEGVREKRAERRRNRLTDDAMRDGSLMEKFTGGKKVHGRNRDNL